MKNKDLWLRILGVGLPAITMLVNRFIVTIPDWLEIIVAVIAIISIIAFAITNRTPRK